MKSANQCSHVHRHLDIILLSAETAKQWHTRVFWHSFIKCFIVLHVYYNYVGGSLFFVFARFCLGIDFSFIFSCSHYEAWVEFVSSRLNGDVNRHIDIDICGASEHSLKHSTNFFNPLSLMLKFKRTNMCYVIANLFIRRL